MDRYRRKKKEDEEAELTKAYEQFREAFEDASPVVGKSFVRGAIFNADKIVEDSSAKPAVYNPKFELPKKSSALNSFEQAKKIAEQKAKRMMDEARKANLTVNRPVHPGKSLQKCRTSNLEAFKEELKSMQEEREQRRYLRNQMEQMGVEKEALDRIAPLIDNPYLHGSGEYDNDPNTTNIYLSNLALEIKIEDLYNTFGTFGPLASAKILYPREEDKKRDHLCGFIAFMVRNDTDRAIAGMQGKMIKGCELRLSLAKPVNIPPQPIYVPPALLEFAMPDPPTGLPFNAKSKKSDLDALLEKSPLPRLGAALPEPGHGLEEYQRMIKNSIVRVVVPTERNLLLIIHRTIEFLIREGPLFEAILMSRERHNPVYRFLFDNHHPAHVYYRWKLYSLLQGDSTHNWRLKRFRMFDEGSWWQPPPHNLLLGGMPECLYSTSYSAGSSNERTVKQRKRKYSSSEDEDDFKRTEIKTKWKGVLSTAERDELEDILRGLLPEKVFISDAMVWCVEHATCAKEITQCLLESLTIDETPLHKKIARLYLISDILSNCAARVKDVFYYRQYIGDLLPEVFKELNKSYELITARLKAEQFKQRVMLCFRAWEDNSIYPTEVLIQLQNIFLGLAVISSKQKESGDISEEDIDGAPIEESFEESIKKHDTIFNEYEDIDGEPIDEESTEAFIKKIPAFKQSQWNTVDPSVVASQAVTTSKWELLDSAKYDESLSRNNSEEDIDGVPVEEGENGSEDGECVDDDEEMKNNGSERFLNSNSKVASTSHFSLCSTSFCLDEERRKILREIEMKVVKYQDELEMQHRDDVPSLVEKYRTSLLKKMDEKLNELDIDKINEKKATRPRKRSRNRKHDLKKDDKDNRGRNEDGFKGSRGRSKEDEREKLRGSEGGRSTSKDRRSFRRGRSNERRKK